MEYTINERMRRSVGLVHIDPVPDRTPSGKRSDFLATFIDHHGVMEDCRNNKDRMKEVLIWVVTIVMVQLPDLIRNNPKLTRRLRVKFATEANPNGVFNSSKLKIRVIDYQCTPISAGAVQGKFWFQLLIP